MDIMDPKRARARYERELQGDFSEIDAYLRADRRKMVLVAIGIAACLAAIAISGCATWEHPTKPASAWDRDIYECEVQAAPANDPWRVMAMKDRCMRLKGWRQ